MSQTPNNFAPRISQRAYRLQRMEELMTQALAATGDDRTQRQLYQVLINEAAAIKEPINDWMARFYKNLYSEPEAQPEPVMEKQPAATVEGFVCDTCNRSFRTKHALCGHQRTHAKP